MPLADRVSRVIRGREVRLPILPRDRQGAWLQAVRGVVTMETEIGIGTGTVIGTGTATEIVTATATGTAEGLTTVGRFDPTVTRTGVAGGCLATPRTSRAGGLKTEGGNPYVIRRFARYCSGRTRNFTRP